VTAAVRTLLTPVYWLAVVIVWLAATPLLLAPLDFLHGWQANLGGAAAGAVIPGAAMLTQGPILDRSARYVAGLVEGFAAEWRKLLAEPPPSGGTPTDGQTSPATERITP
jgi:hypothetical protein